MPFLLYELFCHLTMFSIHFDNVLVNLQSGATSFIDVKCSEKILIVCMQSLLFIRD